jgi:hypothetical protein
MQPTVRAEVEPFLIDSTQGWSVAVEAWQPLAFVELDRCDESLYGPGGAGFIRLNIGCPRPMLQGALHRMAEALVQ